MKSILTLALLSAPLLAQAQADVEAGRAKDRKSVV